MISFPKSPVTRRHFLRRAGVAAVFAISPANGGWRPLEGKTVRWIVPFSPGGGYDLYSRLIRPFFEQETGARVVVDNVAGAGGRLGALQLRQARPDGTTLGVLGASGILVAGLSAEENAPDLLTDFTLLARLSRIDHVWAASHSGELHSFDEVMSTSRHRPILFTVNELGSTAFFSLAATTHILGLRAGFVAGYPGSVNSILAVVRGEVDIVAQSLETLLPGITQGELRPLLQIADEPISDHPAFQGVPLLGGEDGIAARHARERGEDPKVAVRDSTALANLVGQGRLAAGPPEMAAALSRYLEEVLARICASSSFRAAAARAGRTVQHATGESVRAAVRASVNDAKRFAPIVFKVAQDVRNGVLPC